MKGFISLAQPMRQLTVKDVKFTWSEECEKFFYALKYILTSAPILVIAYATMHLRKHEGNYPTHDLEMAVVVSALKIWRSYLYGVKVQMLTYHQSLKYIFTKPELNLRKMRRMEFMADKDFNIPYHLGKANPVANALSQKRADVSAEQEADDLEGMVRTLHLNALTGTSESLGLEVVNQVN
ncbi:hypothetical protein N665_0355s0017 [Sinapis alba]|nr:hypothetical protein N665_0355s0017 [Sinapis alba]